MKIAYSATKFPTFTCYLLLPTYPYVALVLPPSNKDGASINQSRNPCSHDVRHVKPPSLCAKLELGLAYGDGRRGAIFKDTLNNANVMFSLFPTSGFNGSPPLSMAMVARYLQVVILIVPKHVPIRRCSSRRGSRNIRTWHSPPSPSARQPHSTLARPTSRRRAGLLPWLAFPT